MTTQTKTLLWSIFWGIVAFIAAMMIDHFHFPLALVSGLIMFIFTYTWNRKRDKRKETHEETN